MTEALPHTGGLGDYLGLFWQADPVVKSIMIGLLAASVLSWAVIIERSVSLWWSVRQDRRFVAAYRSGRFSAAPKGAAAWLHGEVTAEARQSAVTAGWRECVEGRLRLVLAQVQRKREKGLSYLATVASSGPFVGLFGTVWGIMASFTAIAETKNTSLAVVAPGIAEALLATALGLFAAIPAAIFFNRLSAKVNGSLGLLDELGQEILIDVTRDAAKRATAP